MVPEVLTLRTRVIVPICNVDVAGGVYRHTGRFCQLGSDSRAIVANSIPTSRDGLNRV